MNYVVGLAARIEGDQKPAIYMRHYVQLMNHSITAGAVELTQ
jgi:hypothetical protein